MRKYILLYILAVFLLTSCTDLKDSNAVSSTLIQPAYKTIILQKSNGYTDNISISYPEPENISIEITSDNENVLLNGKKSVTLYFDKSNHSTPQEIHFSTSLKVVTDVCLGQEFNLKYTITNQNTGESIIQTSNGYIIDENHSTNFYLNQNGNAPLTVTANIITSEPVTLEYSILNKTGTDISLTKKISTLSQEHNIDIYGLYENHLNLIEVKGIKADGLVCFSQKIPVKTENINLAEKNPDGTIGFVTKIKPEKIDNSWLLMQLNRDTRYKVMLDLDGNIRWILKTDENAVPIKFIKDEISSGNDMVEIIPLYGSSIKYYDMAGRLLPKSIDGLFDVHHDSVHIPEENSMLILASSSGRNTVEDIVTEYNTETHKIVNNYDLSKLLPINRRVNIRQFINDHPKDYLHTNSIDYDKEDSGVIISGRHQGVFKFNRDFSEVKWIISPHVDWTGYNIDNNTVDLTDKLLTPVDMQNNPITNQQVLNGFQSDEESGFDWPWGQHNAKILSKNGNILTLIVFDNGDNRQRKGEYPISVYDKRGYSRTVIYEIDEKNMTIKQIWQTGKQLGTNGYSQIMSNSERLSNGNIQMHSAFVIENEDILAHSSYYEYDYNDTTTPVYQIIFPEKYFTYRIYRINPFDKLNNK